ncbi:Hint domain-containing protein [Sulfitobacter sp. S190]|uniref:Hint domain-containing protein n=1 Tax=Sulfitobacter sp. S190 TaxID=2867022 RepID=UPI00220FC628|nr:Hint domain-containing protein [Sulfitobacter sp. S190]UWR21182.1 Hint domain-containing protein [Sulfitobacter sp. S190]
MATHSFIGLSPSTIQYFTESRLRVDPSYNAATALSFTITDDDGTWSGDAVSNETADDTSQQTTTLRDSAGNVLASGPSYLESRFSITDETGGTVNIYAVEIGGTAVGYVADGQLQPGNTYTYTPSNVTNSNAPSYTDLDSQTYASGAANAIKGTGNADNLLGGESDDTIHAGGGNDFVAGGDGNDRLFGEGGNDTLSGGDGGDLINGQEGDDSLDGGAGFDNLYGNAGNDTLSGGEGADFLFGGAGDDVVSGGDDGDTFFIENAFGNDTISGGEGGDDADSINANPISGPVLVRHSSDEAGTLTDGTDTIAFSQIEAFDLTSGADTVYGESDSAGFSADGGAGDDFLRAGSGADSLIGGSGRDTLSANLGDDTLDGGDDADVVAGGSGDDLLAGGAGDDVLRGENVWIDVPSFASQGGAATTLTVTNDADGPVELWWIDNTGALQFYQTITAGQTVTQSTFEDDNWVLRDENGFYLQLIEGGNQTVNYGADGLADTIEGGTGADTIVGNFGDDSLDGGAGDDSISGGYGDDTLFGKDGADTLSGGAGNDFIDDELGPSQNGSGNDVFYGGAGSDTVWGGDDADTLFGDEGNDFVGGESGADAIYGGSGSDTLEGGGGADLIGGDGGTDRILGGDGNDTIDGGNNTDTVFGGAGDDVITDTGGAMSDDTIYGEDGNDWISGGVREDFLSGGSGDDTVDGGEGDDTIEGGIGNDSLIGGDGGDTIAGGDGNDWIDGGDGNDSLSTGLGEDTLFGGAGDDTLTNSDGDDSLVGGTGDDSIVATGGNDTLEGEAGNDTLIGGADDDRLVGGAGADSMDGGEDADVFVIEDSFGNDTILGGEGVTSSSDSDTIVGLTTSDIAVTFSGDEAGTFTDGTDTISFSEIENIFTGDGDDLIDAFNDGVGVGLFGFAGEDTIIGGGGADYIEGGDGADQIDGDQGDDTVFGGEGGDSLFGWTGNDSIEGGAGDDLIQGQFGDDTIDGGTGSDMIQISANADTDTIVGGDEGGETDTLDFVGSTAVNVLLTGDEAGTYASTSGTADGIFSEIEFIDGTSGQDTIDARADGSGLGIDAGNNDDTVMGGDGADLILGQGGNDSLTGGAGGDTIAGGDGDDYIEGGAGDDVLTTGEGQDTLLGGDGDDTLSNSAGDDSLVGGAGNDSITATLGDDTLEGGDGNDTLDGGADDDRLEGGAGDDLITGGTGDDTFVYAAGDGSDTITDFNTGNTGTLDDGDTTNNDFIDLSGFYDDIWELHADQADDGILNQSNDGVDGADYSDNDSFGAGSLTFQGARADNSSFTSENTGVVCFASGTLILTQGGEVPIERLCCGDRVVTHTGDLQRIQWIAHTELTLTAGQVDRRRTPVRIKPRAGNRALLVSPQHCMLVVGPSGLPVFVRARHLAEETTFASFAKGRHAVTYWHILLDRHAAIIAQGLPSESFYPGPYALGMLPRAERARLLSAASRRGGFDGTVFGPRAFPVLPRGAVRRRWKAGTMTFAAPPCPNLYVPAAASCA